jgi:hypothetical protein
MYSFRRLVLCLLIAWLPVQGLAAVAMPFCKHMQDGSGSHRIMPAGNDHHQHGGHGEELDHHAGFAGIACDDCSACHLASGSLMLTADVVIVEIRAEHALHPRACALRYFFFPEQPSRPPLTTIA